MRVVVSEFMSLDGVVQAPGGPEEDTSGGFRHGGWSMPFFDPEVMGQVISEFAERSDALLQGRRTYQVSAAAWPERGGDPFADWINRVQKYVVSDTLSEADLTWKPTKVIRGADLVTEVAALRNQPGATRAWLTSSSMMPWMRQQAPGGRDEDTSGGFRHGGWSMPFFDPEVMGQVINEFA